MRRELWLPFRSGRQLPKQDEERATAERVVLADVRDPRDEIDTEFGTEWDDVSGLAVLDGEFVTTTAQGSSNPVYQPISRLLQQVRERVGLDVVFIAQFVDGERLVRHVAAHPHDPTAMSEGHSDPLEATYCQRVVDGRLPEALPDALLHPQSATLMTTRRQEIRAHVATPVVTQDGRVYGTICAYAHQPRADLQEPLAVLRVVARALARALERSEAA